MAKYGWMAGALALAALGGCATLTDTNQQVVAVQTVQDNVEITGVGCVLSNKAGRWFVTAPGRVTIRRSAGELMVDCRKQGTGAGHDLVAAKLNTVNLMGNVVVSAGIGYFVDKHSGAGYDYPATLTVIMRAKAPPAEPDTGAAGNAVY